MLWLQGTDIPPDDLSRGGSGEGGRSRWEGASGDMMTIVGACRDTLRLLRAELGSQPEELPDMVLPAVGMVVMSNPLYIKNET